VERKVRNTGLRILDGAHEPVQQRGPLVEFGGIVTTRQQLGQQREDHKPGLIQTNRNSENLADWDVVPIEVAGFVWTGFRL
jgi:hypothetical protein